MKLKVNLETRVQNEGSVVLLEGLDETGEIAQWFAADHRPASTIIAALLNGDEDEIEVEVESWQLWGPPHSPRQTIARLN